MLKRIIMLTVIFSILAAGCNLPANMRWTTSPVNPQAPAPAATESLPQKAAPQPEPPVPSQAPAATATTMPSATPTLPPTSTRTTAPTATQAATATATKPPEPVVLGPNQFPANINPLTGLPVKKPENLHLAPALVSITQFPATSRPQAGLASAPITFELYIGEGMSRALALFYGDYPSQVNKQDPGKSGVSSEPVIGPIRSGRLAYENLRALFNGTLVMASAASQVSSNLSSYTNIFGSDGSDVNSAMIKVNQLETIAAKSGPKIDPTTLTGNLFDPKAPAGGVIANKVWLPFSYLNQIFWVYDPSTGSYLRYQDDADGVTFIKATDRLTGETLTYENVVFLFVTHKVQTKTIYDLDLMYITKMPAILMRDGKMYDIFWTTKSEEFEQKTGLVRPIRYIDAAGNPFPLKPGQTWVVILQPFTTFEEVIDSKVYFDLITKPQPGSGVWAVRFIPPIP
ncbi:MAG TPA: DUF3048 C-terminal domain-containing protein [Anaerolineaceae bacterium]